MIPTGCSWTVTFTAAEGVDVTGAFAFVFTEHCERFGMATI